MSQFSYPPADSQLVDHIINELKSKGMFDAFRKECIADVDTKPAYQNLRLRVEGTVSAFLKRQSWKPDLNKNQLRETLRKHIYETNFLEQGVERIVDQVVNPKIASVFIPQVEDLVYSYLGLQKPKCSMSDVPTNSKEEKYPLSKDLENVSLDSVKSNDENIEVKEVNKPEDNMDIDQSPIPGFKETTDKIDEPEMETEANDSVFDKKDYVKEELIITTELSNMSIDIPLPNDPPKNIPYPDSSPKDIPIPDDPTYIPMPDNPPEIHEDSADLKNSDTETSIDSAIIRNVSPLTPVRSFNNENSCDAQPPFAEKKYDDIVEPDKITEDQVPISKFRFTIEKDSLQNIERKKSVDMEKNYPNDININNYGAPNYDDSSCSNNLHIDYQSDKDGAIHDNKSNDTKQELVVESKSKEKGQKKNHRSSHSSRDLHRHSSYKYKDSKSEKRSSDKKDSNRSDRKPSRDESSHTKSRHSSHQEKSKDRNEKVKKEEDKDKREDKDKKEKKDDNKRDKDRHSSYKSSGKDKSKHSSSSSRHHSSFSTEKNKCDDKKSKSDEKNVSSSRSDKKESKLPRDHSSHSSSHRTDKERSKSQDPRSNKDKENRKDDKKDKRTTDDHYSASGRGNRTRRSTDRDSNDGNSSSSKGSTFMSNVKSSNNTTDNKSSTSKSENQSSGTDSTGQSDSVENIHVSPGTIEAKALKPVIKLDSHLNTPVIEASISVVEKVKKPMIAANMNEAIKFMKIRKQMAAEEERKRQEAALLLEFQGKIHSSVSQVYSGISGPELEFACVAKNFEDVVLEEKSTAIQSTKSQEIGKVTVEQEYDSDGEDDYLNFVYGDLNKEIDLKYFGQQELYAAELERNLFSKFYNSLEKVGANKIFLLNCDFYHEHAFRAVFEEAGSMCEIIHFDKGKIKSEPSKLKMQTLTQSEVILPGSNMNASFFSPSHSDCSLDMCTDYEKRIDEIINSKSRKDVMEIILGGELMAESPTEFISFTTTPTRDLKRTWSAEFNDSSQENNNFDILTPSKLRRLSLSDQISSTTKAIESIDDNRSNAFKSKYIGKAHRIGLPKPKSASKVSMSPSSDKSVENYVQNSQMDVSTLKLNGALTAVKQSTAKKIRRTKEAQRYDTSDLYKPKFSYLSKRHGRVT